MGSIRRGSAGEQPTLGLLGAPRVRIDGDWRDLPPTRWVALLAYVARSGAWVRREALAAMFWPDHDKDRANWNLRQSLQTIARSHVSAAFEREPTRVRWNGTSDVATFETHVQAQAWRKVVGVYGGTFLEGLEETQASSVQEWLAFERTTLADRWRTGVLSLAEQRLNDGHALEALDFAERLLACDPLDETVTRMAMRAAVAAGDRHRAARVYRSLRTVLEAELGVEPEPATEALAEAHGISADSRRGPHRNGVERGLTD
ncbi:MAG: BTAD domain-containing putative transcriptional regulator [Trueperaceae bacterium]